ncbi:MAG: HEAT repeat domain-containing protein [Asgard group archaeon]|nr:HEAT repeat domain-containing protein [Asgard group archaeon]
MKSFKCEKCGASDIVYQLRFYYIIGLIFYSFKNGRDHFRCEEHKGIRVGWFEIVTCLFLGWWAHHAFLWNIEALASNFRGGIIVNANVSSVSEIQSLIKVLGVKEMRTVEKTVLAILKKGDEAIKPLIEALGANKDPQVRLYSAYLLGEYENPLAKEGLQKIGLKDKDSEVRKQVIKSLTFEKK